VVTGVSTLFGNLSIIGAQVYQDLAGFVTGLSNIPTVLPYIYHGFINNVSDGVSSLFGNLSILGSTLGRKLRIYMRIGGGRF